MWECCGVLAVRHHVDMPEPELSEQDRALLEFEERWGSRLTGVKEAAMLADLGLRPAAYYQRLHVVIDKPAAIAEMPELVKRLQRIRARRVTMRAGRKFEGVGV